MARCSGYTRRHIAMHVYTDPSCHECTDTQCGILAGRRIDRRTQGTHRTTRGEARSGARTASRPPSPLVLGLFASAGRVR